MFDIAKEKDKEIYGRVNFKGFYHNKMRNDRGYLQ